MHSVNYYSPYASPPQFRYSRKREETGLPDTPPRSTRLTTPPKGAPQTPLTPDVERAMALRDVMDHVIDVSRPDPSRRRIRRTSGLTALICVALLGLSVYSWIARPAAIWGPGPKVSPVVEEAGMRFSMFLLAQRIEAFRDSVGRYPPELGDQPEGIAYAFVTDSLFELRASVGGTPIVFRSNESVDEFLGNSGVVIAGSGR